MGSEETSQRVLVPVCRVLKMLVLTLLVPSSQAEDFLVVGFPQRIAASVGDDVVLPCRVVPDKDVSRFTVEWSKPDLQPHPEDRLSRVELVHLYRNSREVQEMKLQSYAQRTALFADGLRRGNISLKIRNVTLEDGGRYKCLVPKLQSLRPYSIIHLDVVAQSPEVRTTETPLTSQSPQTLQPTGDPEREGDLTSPSSSIITIIIAVTTTVMMLMVFTAVGFYLTTRLRRGKHFQTPAAACERDPL
ncbi:uncharacterized protein V6R79_017783 [Siganus canaliculatus]